MGLGGGGGGEGTGLICLNEWQTRLGHLVHTLELHAGVRRDSPDFLFFTFFFFWMELKIMILFASFFSSSFIIT